MKLANRRAIECLIYERLLTHVEKQPLLDEGILDFFKDLASIFSSKLNTANIGKKAEAEAEAYHKKQSATALKDASSKMKIEKVPKSIDDLDLKDKNQQLLYLKTMSTMQLIDIEYASNKIDDAMKAESWVPPDREKQPEAFLKWWSKNRESLSGLWEACGRLRSALKDFVMKMPTARGKIKTIAKDVPQDPAATIAYLVDLCKESLSIWEASKKIESEAKKVENPDSGADEAITEYRNLLKKAEELAKKIGESAKEEGAKPGETSKKESRDLSQRKALRELRGLIREALIVRNETFRS